MCNKIKQFFKYIKDLIFYITYWDIVCVEFNKYDNYNNVSVAHLFLSDIEDIKDECCNG